jgi:hypothetical protein
VHYIVNGERNLWTMLPHIMHSTSVERKLTDCMAKLRRQANLARSRPTPRSPLLTHSPSLSPGPGMLRRGDSTNRFDFDDSDMLEAEGAGSGSPRTGTGLSRPPSFNAVPSALGVGLPAYSPSPTAPLALVKEVEALREENARLREALAQLQMGGDGPGAQREPEEDDDEEEEDSVLGESSVR